MRLPFDRWAISERNIRAGFSLSSRFLWLENFIIVLVTHFRSNWNKLKQLETAAERAFNSRSNNNSSSNGISSSGILMSYSLSAVIWQRSTAPLLFFCTSGCRQTNAPFFLLFQCKRWWYYLFLSYFVCTGISLFLPHPSLSLSLITSTSLWTLESASSTCGFQWGVEVIRRINKRDGPLQTDAEPNCAVAVAVAMQCDEGMDGYKMINIWYPSQHAPPLPSAWDDNLCK